MVLVYVSLVTTGAGGHYVLGLPCGSLEVLQGGREGKLRKLPAQRQGPPGTVTTPTATAVTRDEQSATCRTRLGSTPVTSFSQLTALEATESLSWQNAAMKRTAPLAERRPRVSAAPSGQPGCRARGTLTRGSGEALRPARRPLLLESGQSAQTCPRPFLGTLLPGGAGGLSPHWVDAEWQRGLEHRWP